MISVDELSVEGSDVVAAPEAGRADRPRGSIPPSVARWLAPVVALCIGLVGWQLLSLQSDGWVPSLTELWTAAGEVLREDTLLSDIGITLRRVVIVWAGSLVIGVVVGIAAGVSWQVRAFLRPILAIALAIPDLLYIILVVLVLGTEESSSLIALVVAISPLVVSVVMTSVMERSAHLDEMASAYRLGRVSYLRNVLWYQLAPAVKAGTRTAFAFSWKLMVLVEALTSPDGVGARIMQEFKFLRSAEMIVYAVIFTVLMKLIEVTIVLPVLRTRQPRRVDQA